MGLYPQVETAVSAVLMPHTASACAHVTHGALICFAASLLTPNPAIDAMKGFILLERIVEKAN